jgi:hypothetical protein
MLHPTRCGIPELFKPDVVDKIVEIYAPVGPKSSFAADPLFIKSIQEVRYEFVER